MEKEKVTKPKKEDTIGKEPVKKAMPVIHPRKNPDDKLKLFKEKDKYGYAETDGYVVIEPFFHYAEEFENGIARVRRSFEWGIIDTGGRYLIEPRYDDINKFQDGVAKVRMGHKWAHLQISV